MNILLLAAGAVASGVSNPNGAGYGEQCSTDQGCEHYCCDNDEDFSVTGLCIEVEKSSRCSKRKVVGWVCLVAMILGLFAFLLASLLIKMKQIRTEAIYLKALKEREAAKARLELNKSFVEKKLGSEGKSSHSDAHEMFGLSKPHKTTIKRGSILKVHSEISVVGFTD